MITLAHGAGGKEMQELIADLGLKSRGRWKHCDDDSAVLELGDKNLIFTTDSYTVDPIFFPGADIGHLAFSGTVNDLLMMGAEEISLSLALIIEEGFPKDQLMRIMGTIKDLSEEYGIPIATGDTKVMNKGKVDKIVINTAGIGITKQVLNRKAIPGDKIIASGPLGDHAIALLSQRFGFETDVISDSKPLVKEFDSIRDLIKAAKDPTRGGPASAAIDIAEKNKIGLRIEEELIPVRHQVKKAAEMLGIDYLQLASEGRFICLAAKDDAEKVVKSLQKFNEEAAVIGEVIKGNKVVLKTRLGERFLAMPTGRIVPRIC